VNSPLYYLWCSDQQVGPYTITQLSRMWCAGSVNSQTLWWNEASQNWQPLADLESELAEEAGVEAAGVRELLSACRLLLIGAAAVLTVIACGFGMLTWTRDAAGPVLPAAKNNPLPSGTRHSAAEVIVRAEDAIKSSDFGRATELFNTITAEYPESVEAGIVAKFKRVFRDKTGEFTSPLTTQEAARIRVLLDAFQTIKISYQNSSPVQRNALEVLFGAEALQQPEEGLKTIASVAENLLKSREEGLLQKTRFQ